MSPFAHLLHDLRMRHGIRQRDLAEQMGYETSYFSALEVGIKGPPPAEFVERLIAALNLSEAEQEEVRRTAVASQRKLQIEHDTPQDVFWMLAELRERVSQLHPVQVRMIREILELPENLAKNRTEPIRRIKRRGYEGEGGNM